MSNHATLAPHSAHRWLLCPGSIAAEASLPPSESSYASEGVLAHELAAAMLSLTRLPEGITQEMEAYVLEYVAYVQDLGGRQEYEQRVNLGEWVPNSFGTADAIVVDDTVLHVIDLKYGKGHRVWAELNPQLMLYALGALSERELGQRFSKVVITVHQPRLDHVDSWELTPEVLYHWAEEVKIKARACLKPKAPRVAGDTQCLWCRAKATCPALLSLTECILMREFDTMKDQAPSNPDSLTDDQLRLALNNKKLIASWLDAVEKYVKMRVETTGFDGFKLVEGRSVRRWGDEEVAGALLENLLGENAYTRKLLSAPQAEKALGKKRAPLIQDLIVKPAGAPTLVADIDGRPDMGIDADDFE